MEQICIPLIESLVTNYVDSNLLIEIIRSLLFSTRFMLEERTGKMTSQNKATLELVNMYFDRLDVIRMLINSNHCTKETVQHVLNNNIQKLLEKLLEMERFELAIDIAKKYGVDASFIWKCWALICLKHFQYSEARQKFTRYFDQIKRPQEVQSTLSTVLEVLIRCDSFASQSVSAKDKCNQILSGTYGPGSVLTNNVPSSHSPFVSAPLKPRIFEEICYYFKQYGTYENLIQFYVDHLYWKEAVELYIQTNRNKTLLDGANSSFLKDLFLGAHKKGTLTGLMTAIKQCDPRLDNLWSSLIATCKYLDRNEQYSSLYNVQVFMNDYLRAAITQINCFFLSSSVGQPLDKSMDVNSYDLLYSRVVHLEKARDRCNMYLHNMDYSKVKPGCLVIEKRDVLKQIKQIEFQINLLAQFKLKKVRYPIEFRLVEQTEQELINWAGQIDHFMLLITCYVLHNLQSTLNIVLVHNSFPPTLLEQDAARKNVVAALIIVHYCSTIQEGFQCALRTIEVNAS